MQSTKDYGGASQGPLKGINIHTSHKMLALTFHGKEQIRVSRVPIPEIQSGTDVIVKTSSVGLCGSDLHTYHEREKGCDHGCIMGHEFVGVVTAVGGDVTALRVGDRVMSPFTTNCGSCFYCKNGLTARCDKGQLFGWRKGEHGLHGGQAEFVRVPMAESTLEKVPSGVSDDEAILLGDILSTAYMCCENGGLAKLSSTTQDESKDAAVAGQSSPVVVVIGLGPVGLLTTMLAKSLGAQTVLAVDRVPARLEQAAKFGAVPVNLDGTGDASPLKKVAQLTDGRGADVVLEVVGVSAALKLAIQLIRPGGVLSSVGAHTDHAGISPVDGYDKNLTFRIGRCSAHHYMKIVLPLLLKDPVLRKHATSIITHHVPLDKGAEAYRMFDKKEDGCLKVVLTPPITAQQGSTEAVLADASDAKA